MRLSLIVRPLKRMFKDKERAEAVEIAAPYIFYTIASLWISSAVSSSEESYPKYLLANPARSEMTKGRSSAEASHSRSPRGR